jgi:hypothetical protein
MELIGIRPVVWCRGHYHKKLSGSPYLNDRCLYPEGYRNFARILSSNLKPGGLFLTRLHTQSEPVENPQGVAALYLSAGITDYHELRFRFITAMQPDIYQGVLSSKDTIDSQIERFGISLPELYRRTGYTPPPEIKNFPVRTGAPPMKATYPTQSEFLDSVRRHLVLWDVRYGDHALARQCPIFAFRPVMGCKQVSCVDSGKARKSADNGGRTDQATHFGVGTSLKTSGVGKVDFWENVFSFRAPAYAIPTQRIE